MKKIISLIIAVLLLVSCFSFTAFANESPDGDWLDFEYANIDANVEITFSDDYKILYFGNEPYVRFSLDEITSDTIYEVKNKVVLNKQQKQEVEKVILLATEKGSIFSADIYYADCANLYVEFIKEELYNEYQNSQNLDGTEYSIDFFIPDGNIVKVEKDKLYGKEVTLKDIDYYYDITGPYYVTLELAAGEFTVDKGEIFNYEDEWYYADCEMSKFINEKLNEEDEIFDIQAYKISDAQLIAQLTEAEEKYYTEDFGFLVDDELTEKIANIFFIILFLIVPLIIFIFALVLALRSNKVYRKMFSVISAISAAEVIVFAIVSIILLK